MMAGKLAEETHQMVLEKEGLGFLLSKEGDKVPLSSIERKNVCLFFSANWCRPCRNFAPQLVELYDSVNRVDQSLEILFVSCDRDEASYTEHLKLMPWLAAPLDLALTKRLRKRYKIHRLPSLIPLSPDGKTVEEDAVQLVEEYGVDAYPFGAQRREELKVLDDAKRKGSPLLNLLGSGNRDHLICKDGYKVPIEGLVGKTVGLYFGANWCPPCNSFMIMLLEAYHELGRGKEKIFEIVYVSADRDEEEFEKSLKTMPWLAVPYMDKTRRDLSRIFSIKGIPSLVLLGPDGRKMDADGRAMIASYGAQAFPFTEARATEVRAALEKEGEGLPELVMDARHPHVLKLDMAKAYVCDLCEARGRSWVFTCEKCNYDLHPSCVEHKVISAKDR